MKLSRLVFALLIISNIIGVTFVAMNTYEELLKSENATLASHTERLKRSIETEIMSTEILEEVIRVNNGEIKEDDFYKIAEILSSNKVAASIAYIPDGVIKYLYPPAAGKRVVGNNVFTSKNDAADSKRARDLNQIVISGPYELFQGTQGIVIRNPVYLDDKFWGIVTVALNAEALFKYVGLDNLEDQGYEFSLVSSGTEKDIKAKESTGFISDSAINSGVAVGTSYWNFGLYVKDKTNIIASDAMFWFLIFLFINFILFYFIQRFEQTKETLTKKIDFDALTGAHSRTKLQKFYNDNQNKAFAIFFIDLNKFKPVNDTYGHKVGDKLLKSYVDRIKNDMKADTIIARLGGDEFVVLTPNVDNYEMCEIIKRKLINLSEMEFPIDDLSIFISASIGCVLSDEANSLENLLTIADEKMYAEKGDKAR